jgi:hypothetical protein
MWVFAGSAGMNRELESKLAYCIPRGFYPGRETGRLDSFPDSEILGMVHERNLMSHDASNEPDPCVEPDPAMAAYHCEEITLLNKLRLVDTRLIPACIATPIPMAQPATLWS